MLRNDSPRSLRILISRCVSSLMVRGRPWLPPCSRAVWMPARMRELWSSRRSCLSSRMSARSSESPVCSPAARPLRTFTVTPRSTRSSNVSSPSTMLVLRLRAWVTVSASPSPTSVTAARSPGRFLIRRRRDAVSSKRREQIGSSTCRCNLASWGSAPIRTSPMSAISPSPGRCCAAAAWQCVGERGAWGLLNTPIRPTMTTERPHLPSDLRRRNAQFIGASTGRN